ncbi:MAG: SDR family oxidoreductase [Dehalococcoidia bacterium]|nr:MAG: SDR family oxidoreductase [Dehalococcoidia bacterium]
MTTAVITGSASGIGAATQARFEQAGVSVMGIDIKDAEIVADLSTREGRDAAIAGVKSRCNGLDRLVLCAGVATYARPLSLIPAVNYFGAITLLDGLFDLLRRGTDPRAVVILSNSARWLGDPDQASYVEALLAGREAEAARIIDGFGDDVLAAALAYIGSKLALGRALRRRAATWGSAGVRLNGVAPGNTNTPMLQKVMDDPSTRDGVLSMEIPLGRLAECDDIANVVAFLCSPEASYVHGSIVYVDGGIDAHIRPDGF